jgi:hypothetical protein
MRKSGYIDVHVSGRSGDLAADITARDSSGRTTIVQCKRYAPKNKVGSPEIQLFIGMAVTHHNADHMLYVTTSEFTEPARQLGVRHHVAMVTGTGLLQMARAASDRITRLEVAANEEFAQRQRMINAGREALKSPRRRLADQTAVQGVSSPSPPAPHVDEQTVVFYKGFKVIDRRASRSMTETANNSQARMPHFADSAFAATDVSTTAPRPNRLPNRVIVASALVFGVSGLTLGVVGDPSSSGSQLSAVGDAGGWLFLAGVVAACWWIARALRSWIAHRHQSRGPAT